MSIFADRAKQPNQATPSFPDPAAPDPAAPDPVAPGAPAPKRRGRPPGSKNRKPGEAKEGMVPVDMGKLPDEVLEPLALAPLIIARMAIAAKTTERDPDDRSVIIQKGILLDYDQKSMAATVTAFKAWLSTIDLNLSPGYAYLAGLVVCFGSAAPAFMEEASARAEKAKKLADSEKTKGPANAPESPAANPVDKGSTLPDTPS